LPSGCRLWYALAAHFEARTRRRHRARADTNSRIQLLLLAFKAHRVDFQLLRLSLEFVLVSRQELHVFKQHASRKFAQLQVVGTEQLDQRWGPAIACSASTATATASSAFRIWFAAQVGRRRVLFLESKFTK